MALQGIERLAARMAASRARIVEAKSDGLRAVEFRKQEAVAFVYAGELRSGVVRRIGSDGVLVHDEAKNELRLFKYDKVEGGPSV